MGFTSGLRALGIAVLAAAATLAVSAPIAAAANPPASTAPAAQVASVASAASRVVTIAEAQRGKRYAYGAEGPSAFDCSGLVLYAYRRAGLSSRLGGGHSGYSMVAWARTHHRLSRSNPQIGDVVIYGNGAHAAIYIGGGRVISALNRSQGIRITALHALHLPVTGFIHTSAGSTAVPLAATKVKHAATTKAPHATAKAPATAHAPHSAATVRTLAYVNLRSGASTAARLVAKVLPGTTLKVLGSTRVSGVRWVHVTYSGRNAWVRANLVRAA